MQRHCINTWFAWLFLTSAATADEISTWNWIGRATVERIEALSSGYITSQVVEATCPSGVVVWTTNEVVQSTGANIYLSSLPRLLIPDLASTSLVVVGQQTSVWTNVVGSGTATVTNVVTEVYDLYDLDYVKSTNVVVFSGTSNCAMQVVTGRYVTLPLPEPGRRGLELPVVRWLADALTLLIPQYVDMEAVAAGVMEQPLPPAPGDWSWVNYTNLFGEAFYGWELLRTNYPAAFPSLTQSQVWERTGIGTSVVSVTVLDRGTNFPRTVTNWVNGWEVGALQQQFVAVVSNVPRYTVTTNRHYHWTGYATTGAVVTLRRLQSIEDTIYNTPSVSNRHITAFGFVPDELNGRWDWMTNGWTRGDYLIVPDTNGYDASFNGPWEYFGDDPFFLDLLFDQWFIRRGESNLFSIADHQGYPRGCVASLQDGMTGGVFVASSSWMLDSTYDSLAVLGGGSGWMPSIEPDRYQTFVVLAGSSNLTQVCGTVTNNLRPAGVSIDVTIVGRTSSNDSFGRTVLGTITNQVSLTAFGEIELPEPLWMITALTAQVAQVSVGDMEVRVESRINDRLYGRPGRLYSATLMSEMTAVLDQLTHTQQESAFWEVRQPAEPGSYVDNIESYLAYSDPVWPAYGPVVADERYGLSVESWIFYNSGDVSLTGGRTVNGERTEDLPSEFASYTRWTEMRPESGIAGGRFTTNLSMKASLHVQIHDRAGFQVTHRRGFASSTYWTGARFNGIFSPYFCTPDVEIFYGESFFDRVWEVGGAFHQGYRHRLGFYSEVTKPLGVSAVAGPLVDTTSFVLSTGYGVETITTSGGFSWSGSAVCDLGNASWDQRGSQKYSFGFSRYPISGDLTARWLVAWDFTPPPH
ncbi:MAG TPA: hypothetical protein PKC67_02625 [Kiritimatiellia bacterium]|nr:hypothetical protein [Kiritimatiellia bacterium]HMP33221.1 hypothetical protein [Kiritimatiellia bacterium]